MSFTPRQQEILQAALILTAAGGVGNLTTRKLAAALKISEPALYRHFANKSEIVKAMIGEFAAKCEPDLTASNERLQGLAGIEYFVKSRFTLVAAEPALAKVMFAEEIFMGEEEYSSLMLKLMHSHKKSLEKLFLEAVQNHEIRDDIALDMLFRMVFGPVRLLIKQWAMSDQGFDLIETGAELWSSLTKVLK